MRRAFTRRTDPFARSTSSPVPPAARSSSPRGRRSVDAGPQPATAHAPPAVGAARGAQHRVAAGAPLVTARHALGPEERRRAGRLLRPGQPLRTAPPGKGSHGLAVPPVAVRASTTQQHTPGHHAGEPRSPHPAPDGAPLTGPPPPHRPHPLMVQTNTSTLADRKPSPASPVGPWSVHTAATLTAGPAPAAPARHTGADMSAERPGRSATWAKALAAFVLLVLMPLVIWFLASFPGSGAFPW